MTSTPHDALFKYFFEQPEHAAQLFKHRLPPEFAVVIPWDRLTRVSTEFIGDDLAGARTDVLFSAHRPGHPIYLYLLLEHQSTNHQLMPVRIVHYTDGITQRHLLEHPGEVPLVIPLVVSHAPGGWTAARSYHELFDLDLVALGIAPHALNVVMLIEDLAHLTNEELKARGLGALLTLAICALRDSRDADALVRGAVFWAGELVEALRSPNGMEGIRRVSRYLWLTTTPVNFEQFRGTIRKHIPPSDEERIMELTYADEMVRRGEAKGKVELLEQLLVLKFGEVPDQYRERLISADSADLVRYTKQIMSARTIDDVFASPTE